MVKGDKAFGLGLVLAMAPLAAAAQTSAGLSDEEIVVTAQKREQSVLDVPISIGVLSGEQIEDYGVTELAQVQAAVPGLTLLTGSGVETAIIRGIAPPGALLPTVGTFIDDISVSNELNGFGIPFALVDMARVEVLKGPQGTLYGEGSIGGTIKYFSRGPSLDGETHGAAEATYSGVDGGNEGWRASLAGDLPLGDETFGVRLAGFYEDAPGWVDNAFWGDDSNGATRWLIRARATARPTDALTVDLLYQHAERTQDAAGSSFEDYTSTYFTDRPIEDVYDIYGLNVSWELSPNHTLTSVTGFQSRQTDTASDVSVYAAFIEAFFPGTTYLAPLFGNPFSVANPITNIGYDLDLEVETLTEELRLVGALSDAVDYTVGVFWKDSNYVAPASSSYYPDPNVLPFPVLSGRLGSSTEGWAAFGEVTWRFAPQWAIIGGLRYYEDTRTTNQNLISFGVPSPLAGTLDNDAVVPRLVLQFTPNDDLLFYASAGEGFRSGGFQILDVSPYGLPNTFAPETLRTYEVGAKASLLDRALTLEAAIYSSEYEDIQVYILNPLGLQVYANEGRAEVQGFELAARWQATENLFLQAAYGRTEAEYKDGGLTHDPGDPMDQVPEQTWSASVDYRHPLSSAMEGFVRFDYFHQDERPNILRGFSYPNPVTIADPLDQVNARFGVDFGASEIEIFAENLLNEDSSITVPIGASAEGTLQQPLTIGVTVRTAF